MLSYERRRYLQQGNTQGDRVPLLIELQQLEEEGKDVSGLLEEVKKIWDISDILEREQACENFLKKTYDLPVRSDFPYIEPNSLAEIQKEWGNVPKSYGEDLSQQSYLEKVYGAVLGRCCGCLLGKPVEQWSREKIDKFLKDSGQYPLSGYFEELNPDDFPDGYKGKYKKIPDFMVTDDDIEYTMLNLFTLENYGRTCTATDIGYSWLEAFPMRYACSAEKIAYRNMSLLREPPLSGEYCNPYREWIGAQIRADVWGYINPGNPILAAEFAYRDAIVSHVKNGIYCTMFNAALISLAFVKNNMEEIIVEAQQVVPQRSRTAEAISDCLSWYKTCDTFSQALDKMYEKYGHYSFVHAINNLCICLLALLYSNMDFEKCITDAVAAGMDTDCNGATVGSVLGAMLGKNGIPEKWAAPLHDTYHTMVAGEGKVKIGEIAKRIAAFRE